MPALNSLMSERVISHMVGEVASTIARDVQDIIWNGAQFLDAGSAEEIGAQLVTVTPLSPVTIKRKIAKGAPHPEIARVDTMELVNSIRPVGEGVTRYVVVDSPDRTEIAQYQHYGTGTIPERPFMGVSEQATPKIQAVVDRHADWLARVIGEAPLPEIDLRIEVLN